MVLKKNDKNSRVKLSHNRTNSYSQITWIERCVTQHGQVKVSNLILLPNVLISFTGSSLYEECLGMICHSLLYFAILTYIN